MIRIDTIDLCQEAPSVPAVERDDLALISLHVGSSLAGMMLVSADDARALRNDPRAAIAAGISRARFDQARRVSGQPEVDPTKVPYDEMVRTLRAEIESLATPKPPPFVSIVVTTHGRREDLVRCLAKLDLLEYDDFEVILVDNNGPGEGVFDLAGHFTCRYVKEVREGSSWALNAGLAEARGAIVAFTHDDVEVEKDWLSGLVREFEAPEVVAVTGPVLPATLVTEGEVRFEALGLAGPRLAHRVVHGPTPTPIAPMHGTSANMAARREFLDRTGAFNVHLGRGSWSGGSEDLDVLLRALRTGSSVVYTPHAVVRHHHGATLEETHQRAFRRAVSRVAMLASLVHGHSASLGAVVGQALREVVAAGVTQSPGDLGLPRAHLPFAQRLAATVFGPVAYGLSVVQARAPWPDLGEEEP